MKKILSVLSAVCLLALLTALFCGCGSRNTVTLNVYNWGEYISDGSEESLDVNKAFEDYYFETFGERIKVNYTTYASNEDMYAKLKSGATSYDVVIPSDYMIARMITEDMLEPLNFDNIPNYQYIVPEYRNLYYDPDNLYSIPYTYGLVGIIYNTTMVKPEDTGSWELMWNPDYKGKILQFNNSRDGLATAMFYLGIDVNTSDPDEWRAATELMKEQKPLVQSYVMDEIFNKMKGESAAIAAYYAGDFLTMYDTNNDLSFYYPKEGTNVFVDAMCIPKGSPNKELAECYINFMLSQDIAVANAEYICYASPNSQVFQNEDYITYMSELHEDAMEILYPEEELKTSFYYNLPPETLSVVNVMWEELKIDSSVGAGVYLTAEIIVGILFVFFLYRFIVKKRRDNY